MRKMQRKLVDVVKLSAQSQLTINREEKIAYLLGMLETIAKNTKYERDVQDALDNFYKDSVVSK